MKKIYICFGILILIIISCSTRDSGKSNDLSETGSIWNEILNDARWAQNAHNMQSWKLTVQSDNILTGSLDPERLLPETDPYSRQLILSLGAFSEVARLSAESRGLQLKVLWIGPVEWNSDLNGGINLFKWTLEESADRDEVNHLIDSLSSATVKYAIEETSLAVELEDRLEREYSGKTARFDFIRDSCEIQDLKQLAYDAFAVEMEYAPTREESIINTRYGRNQREAAPYGITLLPNFRKGKSQFIEFFARLFPQSPEKYGETAIDMFEKALDSSSVLLSMTTSGNSPEKQFESGRIMQLVWMELISSGYTLLPLSQGLQEYRDVKEFYSSFHGILAEKDETVQMLWAISAPVEGEFYRSPRLEVEDIVSLK